MIRVHTRGVLENCYNVLEDTRQPLKWEKTRDSALVTFLQPGEIWWYPQANLVVIDGQFYEPSPTACEMFTNQHTLDIDIGRWCYVGVRDIELTAGPWTSWMYPWRWTMRRRPGTPAFSWTHSLCLFWSSWNPLGRAVLKLQRWMQFMLAQQRQRRDNFVIFLLASSVSGLHDDVLRLLYSTRKT